MAMTGRIWRFVRFAEDVFIGLLDWISTITRFVADCDYSIPLIAVCYNSVFTYSVNVALFLVKGRLLEAADSRQRVMIGV